MEENKNYKALFEMLEGDDIYFYEKFVKNLNDEEFEIFMNENPDFFQDVVKR